MVSGAVRKFLDVYLKQLDIQGFKSFADRTRLTFEPGMVAMGAGKAAAKDIIQKILGE